MLQDDNKPAAQQPEAKAPKGYETFSMLQDLVYMLSVITILFVFFFRLVGVDGSSMYPTFVDRDFLVLESNVLYRDVQAGDIVVMNVPYFENEGPIVKRVIATGGQTVDIELPAAEHTCYPVENAELVSDQYRNGKSLHFSHPPLL